MSWENNMCFYPWRFHMYSVICLIKNMIFHQKTYLCSQNNMLSIAYIENTNYNIGAKYLSFVSSVKTWYLWAAILDLDPIRTQFLVGTEILLYLLPKTM